MEKLNVNIRVHVLFLLALTFTFGCDRNVNKEPEVRLDLGNYLQNKVGAQNTERIIKVAINVHNPAGGPPVVGGWEPQHHDETTVELPPAEYVIPAREGPGQIVQIMIVRDELTGGTSFDYGDKVIDIHPGDNPVEIVTTTLAAGEASAEAGVRYIKADGSGPTGKLDMLYKPPGNAPMMLVHTFAMVGGWMRAHLFETTPLHYRLRRVDGEEMLLENLNFSHPDFVASAKMMHAKHPVFYGDRNHDEAPPYEQIPASTYMMGFIGPGSSGKSACYHTDDDVPLSKAFVDSSGGTPLQWSGTSGDSGDFHRLGGGVDETTGPCTGGTPFLTTLSFQWEGLGNGGGGDMFGFEGIFALGKGHHGMTVAQSLYQSRLQASQLTWKTLPGVFDGPGAVSGVRVFHRSDPNHNDEAYRDQDEYRCHELQSQFGFKIGGDLVGVAANSVLIQNLAQTTAHDEVVILCPYDAAGNYLNFAAVQVHDIAHGVSSFGEGSDGDITISTSVSSPATDTAVLGGKILMARRRVTEISADGRTLTASGGVFNSPNTEFEVGDEIVWMVLAEEGDYCGPELMAGQFGHNFIDDLDAGNRKMTLRAPVVLDGSLVTSTALTTGDVLMGSGFCRMTVQRVPNFKNLTFDASGGLVMLTGNAMAINGDGGVGVVFRVLQDLSLIGNNNTIIKASDGFARGSYSGDAFTGHSYRGYRQDYLSPMGNGGGGKLYYGGGGGGGGGPGGNGGSASGTQAGGQGAPSMDAALCGSQCPWEEFYIMGGGGGSGGQVGDHGGAGGGIVAVYADKITRPSGTGLSIMRADGSQGSDLSAVNSDAGGGGGGGTVMVITKDLDINLTLYATGGPGGNSSGGGTSRGGGGGGGGRIIGHACLGSGSWGSPDVSAGAAGTGVESNGAAGAAGWTDMVIDSNYQQCYE